MNELLVTLEQQLEILENLKPRLGKFFQQVVYGSWELRPEDVRLVDEIGFALTGVPYGGPKLGQLNPDITIVVDEERYRGPKSTRQEHPRKIIFPVPQIKEKWITLTIQREYGITIWDLLKWEKILQLPTKEVDLNGTLVLVPEPVSHVKALAEDTTLFYSTTEQDEHAFRRWFRKLQMIRDASTNLDRTDVEEAAKEMIKASIERLSDQKWPWLVE